MNTSVKELLRSLTSLFGRYHISDFSACNIQSAIDHFIPFATKKMTSKQEQMSKCVRLCQEHFGGAWHRLSTPEMISSAVKPLSGGLSNYLYIASLPDHIQPEGKEPCKVLLRFYGVAQGDHSAILRDSLVFALLSERGLGPKFYGCFAGGRFEEYIPTRSLRTEEMSYPKNTALIASQMANFHLMEMPLSKEPHHIERTITRYIEDFRANYQAVTNRPKWKEIIALGIDFQKEFDWMIATFAASGSSVRFCHNDVQEGNVLKSSDGGLVLIDFEYAAYNYRGYDVANHFLEWCLCYAVSNPPYFTYDLTKYPSIEQQRLFFHHYLTACNIEPTEEEMDKLYMETQLFQLGPHFLWAFWSLASGIDSEMNFDYMEFALVRFKAYKDHKEHLIKNYPHLLTIKNDCAVKSSIAY